MKQQLNHYDWLFKKCNEINKNNRKCKNDDFWLKLTKIIIENKIISFNNSSIKFIHNKIVELD